MRVVQSIPGFKSLRCAALVIAGIKTMDIIEQHPLDGFTDPATSIADPFCSLAS